RVRRRALPALAEAPEAVEPAAQPLPFAQVARAEASAVLARPTAGVVRRVSARPAFVRPASAMPVSEVPASALPLSAARAAGSARPRWPLSPTRSPRAALPTGSRRADPGAAAPRPAGPRQRWRRGEQAG